jgi:hypothetical protein
MKNYLPVTTVLLAILLLSACTQHGWDRLEETNSACFAAREKFIARDMDGALQIIAPPHHKNRPQIQTTLAEAKIELAKFSDSELGNLVNAVVTTQSSLNIDILIGTNGLQFNQGSSAASTTFKYLRHEVVFTCNFERKYGVWTASSVNWSTKNI